MFIIRVVVGIRNHLPERALEWVLAINIFWWGWRLADPATQWQNAVAWEYMRSFWGEEAWGWVCMTIGGLRILALVINGTFADTIYSRASPYVRATTAGLGAVVWFIAVLSVSAGNTSGSIYQLPLVLDLWCSLHVFFKTGRESKRTAGNAGLP